MTASFRLAALVLLVTACRPDAPAIEQATPPAAPSEAPATTTPPPPVAGSTDTLQLPGRQIVQLRPVPAATFAQLPASGLPELLNDPAAEHLEATQGRVRRQGLDLLLQPTQGKVVRLSSTPEAEFTLQNGDAVRYQYWGSLPAAHQWVVRAWYWEASGTVLVDQRTGRYVELIGDPVASPDGRLVLLTSPGLSGGDQANALSLVQTGADGPRQLWQREPTTWEPAEARWAAPNRVVLQLRHADGEGNITEDAPVTYADLTLPAAR